MIYTALTLLAIAQYGVMRVVRWPAPKASMMVVALIFAVVAGFRGSVGTDTGAYWHIVGAHLSGLEVGVEPGFLILTDLLANLSSNERVVVNLVSTVFFFCIAFFIWRATQAELIYLFAFFAPQYFLNYSMNGLRVGMASVLFLLFFQSWLRGRKKEAAVLAVLSFSMHFSIAMAYCLFFLASRTPNSRWSLILRLGAILAVPVILAGLEEYVNSQFDKYADAKAENNLAGLSALVKIAVFLPFTRFLAINSQQLILFGLISVGLTLASVGITQLSYAGLRLMDISIWLIPLLYLGALPRGEPIRTSFANGLALTGIVGGIFTLRNIYQSAGVGQSPFLPYEGVWSAL